MRTRTPKKLKAHNWSTTLTSDHGGGETVNMSFFLGRGENVVREQERVLYHHGYSRIGSIMRGKLILTNKRFLFLEQRAVKSGGFLGFGKKTEVQTAGVKINLPTDSVIGAIVETRTRKKGTLNQPPSLFSKEQYQVLIVSLDTPEGMENPAFEVYNAPDWVNAIQRGIGGEAV